MKKALHRSLLCLLSAAMISAFTGCDKSQVSTESESEKTTVSQISLEYSETEPHTTAEVSEPEADEPDYMKCYDKILLSACNILSDPYNYEGNDEEIGIFEHAICYKCPESFDNLGYLIQDISGDDIPELVIGRIAEDLNFNTIYSVYSCTGDEPHLLISGWDRNAYYYIGDGRFYNYGSVNYLCKIFGTYRISQDAEELICENYYYSYEKEDNPTEVDYYYNQSGIIDADDSSMKLLITEDQFMELNDELWEQVKGIELIPISSYAADIGYDYNKSENSGTDINTDEFAVSIQFAEDYLSDYSDYEMFIADDEEYSANVLFIANREVADFEFVALTVHDIDDNGNVAYDAETLYSMDVLTAERPLAITMNLPEIISSYGISYTDTYGDGAIHRFSINLSGYDGSVFLTELD